MICNVQVPLQGSRSVAGSGVSSSSLSKLSSADGDRGDPTLGVDVGAGGGNLLASGVDTDGDVADQAILNAVTEKRDADEGVVAVLAGAGQDRVLVVGGAVQGLEVRRVGADGVDLGEQVLLEEELADVLNGALAVGNTAGCVGLDGNVDVGGTRDVVAGELGQELDHAVGVGDLDAAEEGLVVGSTVGALLPAVKELRGIRVNAREGGIGPGGVAVPDGSGGTVQRLTGVDVHDANVEVEVDARLGLAEVVAVHLAVNAVGAEDGLRGQEAGVVLDGGVLQSVALGHAMAARDDVAVGDAALVETLGALGDDLGLALLNGGGTLVGRATSQGSLASDVLLGQLLGVSEDLSGRQGEGSKSEGSELHCCGWLEKKNLR